MIQVCHRVRGCVLLPKAVWEEGEVGLLSQDPPPRVRPFLTARGANSLFVFCSGREDGRGEEWPPTTGSL